MVVLSLRNRQNRECVDEDLRANKKVFERLQQQISIFPQSERPPNDKLQAIAFQFNKDVENVKNALNDGLNDMNQEAQQQVRGFADFSKVSLAWNKLVARINPYIKGQETDPDFQAATAGDYNYVRQKLRDDLQQFFANAIQQIDSFKRDGLAATGQLPRVQNENALVDILQQLGTGFYKNVRYGAEERTSLFVPRLPGQLPGGQPGLPGQQPPGQQPPGPPGQQQGQQQQPPAPQPQQYPQDAQLGNVDLRVLNVDVNPYQQDQRLTPQMNLARDQELSGINQRIVDDINAFEAQGNDVTDPQLAPGQRLAVFTQDVRDELDQFFQLQGNNNQIDAQILGIVDTLADYRNQQGPFAIPQGQPGQQGQQAAPAQPAPAPARRGRPPLIANSQQVVADTINALGLRQQLQGYSGKPKQERRRLLPVIRQVTAALDQQYGRPNQPVTDKFVKDALRQMVGFGMKGGFLTGLIGELAHDAFRGYTGMTPFEAAKGLVKGAYENRGTIADLAKGAFNKLAKYGGAKREGARGRPLRLNNDFTGTSVVPNTLADLKNKTRFAKNGEYVGDSAGSIIPNLQNRGILGSGRKCGTGTTQSSAGAPRMDIIIGQAVEGMADHFNNEYAKAYNVLIDNYTGPPTEQAWMAYLQREVPPLRQKRKNEFGATLLGTFPFLNGYYAAMAGEDRKLNLANVDTLDQNIDYILKFVDEWAGLFMPAYDAGTAEYKDYIRRASASLGKYPYRQRKIPLRNYNWNAQLRDYLVNFGRRRQGGRRLEGGFIQIPSELLKPDGSPDEDWEEVEGSDVTGSYEYPKSLSQKAKELIATQGSRILREAINRFIEVATATPQAALDAAGRTSAAARAALPPVLDALRRAKDAAAAGASATRDVYQSEATQAVINYVSAHPEVLMYYFGTAIGAVAGVATGLVRTYLRRGMRGVGTVPKGFHIMPNGKMMKDSDHMQGAGNGVNVNIKYSKLPKALQPTEEDLNPQPKPRSVSGGMRRRRMPKESYEGYQDEENDVYTHRGGVKEASPLVHSEMLQEKALGMLKGLPRRLGVEDPKFKPARK